MGHRTGQRADAIGSQIRSGEHGYDARHPARRIDVEPTDARMRMRRANDHAMKRVRRRQIGDVTTLADSSVMDLISEKLPNAAAEE